MWERGNGGASIGATTVTAAKSVARKTASLGYTCRRDPLPVAQGRRSPDFADLRHDAIFALCGAWKCATRNAMLGMVSHLPSSHRVEGATPREPRARGRHHEPPHARSR